MMGEFNTQVGNNNKDIEHIMVLTWNALCK